MDIQRREPSRRPIPNYQEIILNKKDFIVSRTDLKGYITYANDYFIEICEYDKEELMGVNHNIIRHPDMPRIIFKVLWDRIKGGDKVFAFVKNLTKTGKFYWVLAEVEPAKKNGEIIGYYSFRVRAPRYALKEISEVYKMLLEAEEGGGMKASKEALDDFLDTKKLTYDEYVQRLFKRGFGLRGFLRGFGNIFR
ncbi:MAG: PAS domain S-box protein [Epsilonproteobacteria bacterium]|nr:PAS domain S-box protein [Campylobacterota bacterium]